MIERLKEILKGSDYSCVAIDGNGVCYSGNGFGVKPIITPMRENISFFENKLVGDKIVGKAAALLLCLSGAKYVYGQIMSRSARDILIKYNIDYSYDTLTEYIENRSGDGMCPLESAVIDCDDKNYAYALIENKIKELMQS